jgi:hypothetical protein
VVARALGEERELTKTEAQWNFYGDRNVLYGPGVMCAFAKIHRTTSHNTHSKSKIKHEFSS